MDQSFDSTSKAAGDKLNMSQIKTDTQIRAEGQTSTEG